MHYIKNLEVNNFRNFKKAKINFNKSVNLIIGKNGQGKTSLLEAISLLVSGSSFRQGKYDSYIKFDNEFSKIKIELTDDLSENSLEYRFLTNKKEFYLNNKKTTGSKIFNKLSYVLFSPESLSSIKNGPEQRRSLIDSIMASFSNENYQNLIEFKKSLKSRNKVLRDYRLEKIRKDQALDILNTLDEIYIKKATEVSYARVYTLNNLKPFINEAFAFISGDKNVDISVDYVISSQKSNNFSKNKIFNHLQTRRSELINAELSTGSSLVGPHKHDIVCLYQGKDSRYYCSQGQQRAYILAIKMAQIVYYHAIFNKYPLLLLDDVMSELDETKRQNLLNFLRGIKAQIFITTTDFNLQKLIDHSNLSVYELNHENCYDLIQAKN